jgi:hypothetical protein
MPSIGLILAAVPVRVASEGEASVCGRGLSPCWVGGTAASAAIAVAAARTDGASGAIISSC